MAIKCIHCIENFVQLDEAERQRIQDDGNFDRVVRDALTYVPSWQLNSLAPGQMAAACVTVPVCLDHIQIQKHSPEQIANRSGLLIPGQS
jgi:hypothetical protein